jgi:hypothetical protein
VFDISLQNLDLVTTIHSALPLGKSSKFIQGRQRRGGAIFPLEFFDFVC